MIFWGTIKNINNLCKLHTVAEVILIVHRDDTNCLAPQIDGTGDK